MAALNATWLLLHRRCSHIPLQKQERRALFPTRASSGEGNFTAPPLRSVVGLSELTRVVASEEDLEQGVGSPDGWLELQPIVRVEEATVSGVERTSIWDALNKAFEPAFRQPKGRAVLEQSGPAPSFFAKREGGDPVQFLSVSVLLIFVWWLGNYYVPDLVFKDTVFRNRSKDNNAFSGETSTGEAAVDSEKPARSQGTGFVKKAPKSRRKAGSKRG